MARVKLYNTNSNNNMVKLLKLSGAEPVDLRYNSTGAKVGIGELYCINSWTDPNDAEYIYLIKNYYKPESFIQIQLGHIFRCHYEDKLYGFVRLAETLTLIDVTELDTSGFTSFSHFFDGYVSLTAIDGLKNLDMSNIRSIDSMFNHCESLRTLDVSHFNTSKCTKLYEVFQHCCRLKTIKGIETFDITNVNEITELFFDCSSLVRLDLSNWNFNKVNLLYDNFVRCDNLKEVLLPKLTQYNKVLKDHIDVAKLDNKNCNFIFKSDCITDIIKPPCTN